MLLYSLDVGLDKVKVGLLDWQVIRDYINPDTTDALQSCLARYGLRRYQRRSVVIWFLLHY